MSKIWNQYEVKKENKTLVLEVIKSRSPISRADIAKITGLNKGTVSSLTSELLDEHLIYESGPGQSSGGRRPLMLLFNHLAGYSIGIDVGVNYLLGILTDLKGNIVTEKKRLFTELTYEEILAHIIEIIYDLKLSSENSVYGVVGIGIGVPGVVSNSGEILFAPNLGWRNKDLKSSMEQEFNVPVTIANEANAGAYGEKTFGAGKNEQDIIYVSVGIGIGVGLILDDKLYKGNNGLSGEFGHMTIESNGLLCRCGNQGCWELYASEQALIKKAKKIDYLATRDDVTLELLCELAASGDERIKTLFSEVGEYLGIGVTNIVNGFNPRKVIIGNRMEIAEQWIRAALELKVNNNSLRFHRNDVKIDFSHLNSHSTALGVAAFSIEKFLEIDVVKGT
ncbi:ROK family transcriptional regulator [Bacillaceae bacterium S4-13-56]